MQIHARMHVGQKPRFVLFLFFCFGVSFELMLLILTLKAKVCWAPSMHQLVSFTRRVVACTVASMFLNTITEEPLRLAYVFYLALSAFETIYNERSVESVLYAVFEWKKLLNCAWSLKGNVEVSRPVVFRDKLPEAKGEVVALLDRIMTT